MELCNLLLDLATLLLQSFHLLSFIRFNFRICSTVWLFSHLNRFYFVLNFQDLRLHNSLLLFELIDLAWKFFFLALKPFYEFNYLFNLKWSCLNIFLQFNLLLFKPRVYINLLTILDVFDIFLNCFQMFFVELVLSPKLPYFSLCFLLAHSTLVDLSRCFWNELNQFFTLYRGFLNLLLNLLERTLFYIDIFFQLFVVVLELIVSVTNWIKFRCLHSINLISQIIASLLLCVNERNQLLTLQL